MALPQPRHASRNLTGQPAVTVRPKGVDKGKFASPKEEGYYFLDILLKILDILWALLYSDAYMEPVPLVHMNQLGREASKHLAKILIPKTI